MKGWLHSLLAPSRAEEARVEEKVEQELPAFQISNEVAQALGAELARMVLPFFVNAIRQQAAQQVEEERGEQTLAALKRAVAMSQGAIAETRRS